MHMGGWIPPIASTAPSLPCSAAFSPTFPSPIPPPISQAVGHLRAANVGLQKHRVHRFPVLGSSEEHLAGAVVLLRGGEAKGYRNEGEE